MKENNDKLTKILYIVVVIAVLLGTFIYHFPEFKKMISDIDNFINIDEYDTIVGIKIESGPEFLLVSNNDKITNILYLNSAATILYDKEIEKNNIKTSLDKILNILEEKDYLQTKKFTLVMYPDNKNYNEIKSIISKKILINEENKTYQDTVNEYEISVSTGESQIRSIMKYSYIIISEYKNEKLNEGITNRMTEEESLLAANRVYEKLLTYALDVENQEINSKVLLIETIPANQDLTIYPSSKSWYYIKNHQVYAYINFTGLTDDYEFCYNGSIEKMKRGNCSWKRP